MPTRKDILFTKIAMKNRMVPIEGIKKCLAIQGELEKLGAYKPIGEVFQENGYLVERDVLRLDKAVKLSEQVLEKHLAQQKYPHKPQNQQTQGQSTQEQKSNVVEKILDKDSWEEDPPPELKKEKKQKKKKKKKKGHQDSSNPFDMETEEFHLSPEGELEAVMVLQKLKKEEAQNQEDMGERFGKFQILGKLGQGGQSEVFKAMDTVSHQVVALKIIKPDIAKDKEFIERFHRETKHLRKFDHPNIVKIFDAGMILDRHYLAMEYVQGETLSERAGRRRLSIPEGCEILKQIAQGLLAAHEKLIVHRDIKMSNILLSTDASKYGFEMEGDPNFQVKIADFGLARSKKDTKITDANQFMGTAKYLAPEQIQHGVLSEKSDVFALGVIAYELLAGEEPFKATSSVGYLHANVEEIPLPVKNLNSSISNSLQAFVMKLLEKDPAQRYNTPALIRDLERLEKTFWGNQRILEYSDEESVFYMGHLDERRRRIKKIALWSFVSLVLISAFVFLRIWSNQSNFNLGKRLVTQNPQMALPILEKSRGWGVDNREVDHWIHRGKYLILLGQGRSAEEDELWMEAIQTYKKGLKSYPKQEDLLRTKIRYGQYKILLARAKELETSDVLQSARLYKRAIGIAVDQKEAQGNLEALLLKIKTEIQKYKDIRQYEKAKKLLKIQAKIVPSSSISLELSQLERDKILGYARDMEDRGEWLEAYGQYGKALKIAKKLNHKKEIQRLAKQRKRAWTRYLFHIQRKKGEKSEKKKDYLQAIRHYKKALNLRDDQVLRERISKLQEKVKNLYKKK